MKIKQSLINPKYEATYEEAMSLAGDMEKYNLAKDVIEHGKHLGKNIFSEPERNIKKLRYATFTIRTIPIPCAVRTILSIPIPYMKNDHGVSLH